MRRSCRHWRVRQLSSFSAIFSQLPCLGRVAEFNAADVAAGLPVSDAIANPSHHQYSVDAAELFVVLKPAAGVGQLTLANYRRAKNNTAVRENRQRPSSTQFRDVQLDSSRPRAVDEPTAGQGRDGELHRAGPRVRDLAGPRQRRNCELDRTTARVRMLAGAGQRRNGKRSRPSPSRLDCAGASQRRDGERDATGAFPIVGALLVVFNLDTQSFAQRRQGIFGAGPRIRLLCVALAGPRSARRTGDGVADQLVDRPAGQSGRALSCAVGL